MASLDTASFVPLSSVRVAHARLLSTACSPDKDLFVLVTRAQNKDRLALWTIKGARKWEVEVCNELPAAEHVISIAWSPDGLTILVAHNPPRLSLHSIQDGRELRSLPIDIVGQLSGVWWLKHTTKSVPEVWKREELIPGSSLSTLQSLPLLDSFKDYYQPSAEAFSFGGQASRKSKPAIPATIASWPALSSNLTLSSIAPSEFAQQDLDTHDDENLDRDSLVVAADSSGALHCFMDGVYPLGAVLLGSDCVVKSLYAPPSCPTQFSVHAQKGFSATNVRAIPVHLASPRRDVARASSAARDLVWYALRVLRDMRETWMGSDTSEGVATLGKRWIAGLEARIQSHSTQPPHPILDLTTLLTTGRISDGLHDMLTGAEKMNGPDRPVSLSKWESSLFDALVKLRDYAERRVYPACQRLLVILQDVRGWSKLPHQFLAFEIDDKLVDDIILRVRRACELSVWLAAAARDELERFRNFITWLKTEMMNASSETTTVYPIKHDALEVNDYIVYSLTNGSALDLWFTGADKKAPQVSPSDRRAPPPMKNLAGVLADARTALQALRDKKPVADTRLGAGGQEIESLERNIETLMTSVATDCKNLFGKASGAATRAATLPEGSIAVSETGSSTGTMLMCERLLETDSSTHYAAVYDASVRQLFIQRTVSQQLDTAVFDCIVESGPADILAMDFFDDEMLAVVLRPVDADQGYLALVEYSSAEYAPLRPTVSPMDTRERCAFDARVLAGTSLPVRQARRLLMRVSEDNAIAIAVNGRAGRRVGCVYASATSELETFDLEGDDDNGKAGEDDEMQDVSY